VDAQSRVSEAPTRPAGPPTVGPYRLLRQIGEGGMGVVHLAVAPDGTRVALKVLRPAVVANFDGRERLAREVAALQRVRSNRVAPLLDADAWGPTPYVVTRFVPGLPLTEYVGEYGPLQGAGLRRIGRGLAEALAAVHAVGIMHRDVKPSNVLLDGDDPVLIDFGLARSADDATVTAGGWMLGTPAYLTPEVVDGHDPGPAGDVHAWASTLVFASTGRSPFGGGHQSVVVDRVRRNAYDLGGVADDIVAVLERCLAVDPRSRPPAALLAGWLAGPGPAGGPSPGPASVPATVALPVAPRPAAPPVAPPAAPPVAAAAVPRFSQEPSPHWEPPWVEPPRPWLVRLLRALVAVLAVAIAAATFAAAPYAATAVWWLAIGGLWGWQLVAESGRERRRLRGRRAATDAAVTVATVPWFAAVAAVRAAALVAAAAGCAGLVAGLLRLFGTGVDETLWVAAGVFLAVLWRGPGGRALHPPAALAVDSLARPDLVGLAVVWLLAALAAGSVGVVEAVGTTWWPVAFAPL